MFKLNELRLILFFSTLFCWLTSSAQHQLSEENKEYIHDKELEMTNDSSYWDNAAVFYLGFNKTGLYNWSAGGMNFMEVHGLADIWIDYRHNKFHWNNFITMSFGMLKSGYGNLNDDPWWKSDDLLEATSKFSLRTKHLWDYSFLLNFRTQFYKGFYSDNERANDKYMDKFLSPVYPIAGIGLDYHANNHLTCYVSPATMKSTIVLDSSLSSQGVFGLNPGQKVRTEFGFYTSLMYSHDSIFNTQGLSFFTDLTAFGNYIESPGNIDITWENLISYQLREFFSITFSSYMIYDHDIQIPLYDQNGLPDYFYKPNGLDVYNVYYDNLDVNSYYYDYDGFVIKTGPRLQFMEYWLLGLTFTF